MNSPDITVSHNPQYSSLATLRQATHPSHDPNAVDAHVQQRSATPRWTWWLPGWLCHGPMVGPGMGFFRETPKKGGTETVGNLEMGGEYHLPSGELT